MGASRGTLVVACRRWQLKGSRILRCGRRWCLLRSDSARPQDRSFTELDSQTFRPADSPGCAFPLLSCSCFSFPFSRTRVVWQVFTSSQWMHWPLRRCVLWCMFQRPNLPIQMGISYLKHPKATSSCWLLLDLTCKNVQKAPIKIIGPVQVGSLPLKLLHFTNKTEGMKI